jgi:hypothetical protein
MAYGSRPRIRRFAGVYAVTVGNVLSRCDDLGHGLVSDRRERQARMDQHDRPDRTEPALANEHAESTEATEPTEPTDKIDPADPTDRIDPVEPMDKMDPLEPMLRIDPAEPASHRERSSFRMKLFSQPGQSPQEAAALPIAEY